MNENVETFKAQLEADYTDIADFLSETAQQIVPGVTVIVGKIDRDVDEVMWGVAVKAVLDFHQSVTQLQNLRSVTQDDIKALAEGILKLATDTTSLDGVKQ